MKVLISGFQPFGEEVINPSIEATKHLPKEIAGHKIIGIEIQDQLAQNAIKNVMINDLIKML